MRISDGSSDVCSSDLVAQIALASEVDGDAFPASAVTVETTKTGGTTSGEYFRDATFSGLKENTEYAYRVGSEAAGWSDVYTFRTQSFSGDFSFLFFGDPQRSEEHTSELQSLMRISYAVFCLKKKKRQSIHIAHAIRED